MKMRSNVTVGKNGASSIQMAAELAVLKAIFSIEWPLRIVFLATAVAVRLAEPMNPV
jgi:hypothetical protein